jgi:hypothetical protein
MTAPAAPPRRTAADEALLGGLDAAALTPIVRRALGRRSAVPVTWRWADLPYAGYLPGRRLVRADGTARVREGTVPWAAVVKIVAPPVAGGGAGWDREARAYRSGLLRRLPGGLVAPRLLHLGRAAGAVWLWLECVRDAFGGRWPLAHYGVAARHLGRFNGAYLGERAVPPRRWLRRDWAAGHSEPRHWAGARRELDRLLAHPDVRAAFPAAEGDRMRRLLDEQPLLMERLARLPQTLCHHDASSANLFARRVPPSAPAAGGPGDGWETVAVDWEELGPGPPGAEAATLVFGSMRRGAVPARRAAALTRTALEGYAAGLRDAGWRGDERQVRLGFSAAVALRWFLIPATLRLLVGVPSPAPLAAASAPRAALLEQRVGLTRFLLDRADEARRPTPPLRSSAAPGPEEGARR